MTPDQQVGATVAIAEIIGHDGKLVDQIEGFLLSNGGIDEVVTPASLANQTSLSRDDTANLFRQLERAGAVERETYGRQVSESDYRIDTESAHWLFSLTRQTIRSIEVYRKRQPPETVARPLVTFPDDPAFKGITPRSLGMGQLLSTIASEVKKTTNSIVIMAPFFEDDGFRRLREVLADAVERGVEITIITRYLSDTDSHNREVIEEFKKYLRRERGFPDRVRTVDYTSWDESTPQREQRQDGVNPAFTLHAKVMLFDADAAYLGSANMTDYGFDRYLELGVLLRGPPVERYQDLFGSILESDAATEIFL